MLSSKDFLTEKQLKNSFSNRNNDLTTVLAKKNNLTTVWLQKIRSRTMFF